MEWPGYYFKKKTNLRFEHFFISSEKKMFLGLLGLSRKVLEVRLEIRSFGW